MVDLRIAQSEDELLDAAERSATRAFQAASGLLLRERLREALLRKCATSVLRRLVEPCGEEPSSAVYTIGRPDNAGGYGMTHGPVPDFRSLLEEDVEDGSVLIRFDSQGQTILYRYHERAGGWYSEVPK